MVYTLLLLIITALACWALTLLPNHTGRARAAWAISLVGVAASFILSLMLEGLGTVAGKPVIGTQITDWLSAPIYRSDALSAGVGAWCLFLGFFALLKIGIHPKANTPGKLAIALLTTGTLYSLAATVDLRAFAIQVLMLAILAWALYGWDDATASGDNVLSRVSLSLGALLLLSAVLLMGRTTGGEYNLDNLSLSALTVWPLALIIAFAFFWMGLAPFTGWSGVRSARNNNTSEALAHALILGIPPLLLILRLQALVTQGALTGSTPDQWAGAMAALAILGGLTTVVAGASTLLWAGTARWSAALTSFWMGLVAWSIGMDTPAGRWAAIVFLANYGIARIGLQLTSHEDNELNWLARAASGLALAGAPLTAGFLGLWLLSGALVETRSPQYAIILLGGAIMAACGTALQIANTHTKASLKSNKRYELITTLSAVLLAGLSIAGGVLPGLWLPQVETIANVAGRGETVELPWTGLTLGDSHLPLTLPAVGVLVFLLLGMLVRVWARSRVVETGVLLPTALARLQKSASVDTPTETQDDATTSTPQPANPFITTMPSSIWWLSLIWLERGIYGAGAFVARTGMRIGSLLARLEGRYFLPLALLLILLTLLAITR